MRQLIWLMVFASAAVPALVVGACGGDDTSVPVQDASADQTTGDGGDPVARGRYIVDTLAVCSDCHTPRNPDGSPNTAMYLAGNDCFIGSDKSNDAGGPGPGCLTTRNLTSDTTGLKNRTAQEIRDMFQNGKRTVGGVLYPVMPYWVYHNMTDSDADAVVAYLRTVPAVAHESRPSQPPWDTPPAAPTSPIDMTTVPSPVKDGNPDYDSQMRGRYLAATAAACIECHTPETGTPPEADRMKWFAGNRVWTSADLGLPSAHFPAEIHSANLTPDPTGIAAYSVADIVKIIKQGTDRDGGAVCPPMPVGHAAPYSNMTDEDATDVAKYLLSLPKINSPRPDCVPTP